METTLSIIKPNAIKNAGKIITMIQELPDTDIINIIMFQFTKDQATKFYEEHKARSTFSELISFMSSGPVIAMILEGPDIIRRHRAIMKDIRLLYTDNIIANAIHGSDSPESAKREIEMVFRI
jgi:nucleoside-diphosphate kinase